jgi:adenosylcobyric acid synthase
MNRLLSKWLLYYNYSIQSYHKSIFCKLFLEVIILSKKALMFQGTGSDVGKSLLVAGLCRVLLRRGLRVAPFKAQNMSNNAGVADDGGEIGRAQFLQAIAAGIAPSIHLNPVLLKPQSDKTSQVIVRGKLTTTLDAVQYQAYRSQLLPIVLESYQILAQKADFVLVEGAGSPAEINLRTSDIANMGFARAANVPVIMVGDIERGGVIASLVGTHTILADADKAMIKGFIVNKFRGDAKLFASGANEISRRTNWHNLGLVPHFSSLAQLPQEDSLGLSNKSNNEPSPNAQHLKIAVLKTPHIANFDDIDPLANSPNVQVLWINAGEIIPADASLVIIAGSKSTISDLQFIKTQGWDIDLQAHVRRGGRVIGICGGYQMLGKTLNDEHGTEGKQEIMAGLGLLDVDTIFTSKKTVNKWHGKFFLPPISAPISGYEIHLGKTTGADTAHPLFISENGSPEGAISTSGKIWGTYIHSAFCNDNFRKHLLASLGNANSNYNYTKHIDKILNDWADVLEQAISIDRLLELAQ